MAYSAQQYQSDVTLMHDDALMAAIAHSIPYSLVSVQRVALADGAIVDLRRIGDFYECYGEAARKVAKILTLTVTTGRNGLPMVGIPYHCVARYVDILRGSR